MSSTQPGGRAHSPPRNTYTRLPSPRLPPIVRPRVSSVGKWLHAGKSGNDRGVPRRRVDTAAQGGGEPTTHEARSRRRDFCLDRRHRPRGPCRMRRRGGHAVQRELLLSRPDADDRGLLHHVHREVRVHQLRRTARVGSASLQRPTPAPAATGAETRPPTRPRSTAARATRRAPTRGPDRSASMVRAPRLPISAPTRPSATRARSASGGAASHRAAPRCPAPRATPATSRTACARETPRRAAAPTAGERASRAPRAWSNTA